MTSYDFFFIAYTPKGTTSSDFGSTSNFTTSYGSTPLLNSTPTNSPFAKTPISSPFTLGTPTSLNLNFSPLKPITSPTVHRPEIKHEIKPDFEKHHQQHHQQLQIQHQQMHQKQQELLRQQQEFMHQQEDQQQAGKMTFKDYAYYLLKREGKPLRVEYIVHTGLREGMSQKNGNLQVRADSHSQQNARNCPRRNTVQRHQIKQGLAVCEGCPNDIWVAGVE